MELLGKSAIWLATLAAGTSLVFYLLGERWLGRARWTFRAVVISLVTAIALLLFLILTHRFEFSYVFSYSSSDLTLYYLISTLWGGQEGTLLLWIVYVSLLALFLIRRGGSLERYAMAIINLFILSVLVILLKRNPFATTAMIPTEGQGLNPLLQDFWMTIHPPVMFLGFALTIFPFALAISGWLRREYKAWAPQAWVWVLGAWCTLATALVMGGYWAYKVLGWGGYWAWDPVENSSLIPWIFASGGIHSLIMLKKKNSLGRSAYLFAVLPFVAVLFGSFLTRSGVLGDFSVHSFLDLGINSYLIASLAVFGSIAAAVLLVRMREVRSTVAYGRLATVDFYVTVGVLSFLVAGVLVAIGMSTPLWTRLGGTPSNVTMRYYFLATTPVALILLFSLSVFPYLRWIKPTQPRIDPRAIWPFTFAMGVGGTAILLGVEEPLYIILLILGAMAVGSNIWALYDRFRKKGRLNGAYIAHIGLALLLVGAAVSSAYERKERVALPLGQAVAKFGWVFTYQGKDTDATDGKTPYHILVQKPGSDVAYIASPLQFDLPYGKGVMRKPAVKKFWHKDLYISPLDETGGGDGSVSAVLMQGEPGTVGGMTMTFLGFEVDGHGEGAPPSVDCPIEVIGEMYIDTLVPALAGTAEGGLADVPVQFLDGRYTLGLERIDAESGAVEVRLIDRDNNNAEPPVFWVEISEKPLINLFWGGSFLMVFGGLLAMRKRIGQLPTLTGAVEPQGQASVANEQTERDARPTGVTSL